jgi:Ca2+-binding RTX toxin-like protein
MPNNIENLYLQGTAVIHGYGNDLNNTIQGNGAANWLDGGEGNDYLWGQEGFDTVYGGFGDDSIYGANTADSTFYGDDDVLNGGFGNDTLYGANGIDKLYGDGGNDVMYGNPTTGSKTADGYADSLYGGLGDDVYYWTDSKDTIEEKVDEGIDSVGSTLTYSMPNNIENLYLQGTAVIHGYGNDLNNTIQGNSAANLLNGLGGADYLFGGGGNDTLVGSFGADTLVGGTGADLFKLLDMNRFIISDFSVVDDSIQLNRSVFTLLQADYTQINASGASQVPSSLRYLDASNFVINASALDNNDYLIYNNTTGELSYDADANGSAAPTPIALLSANLALTNLDFYI